MMFIKTKHHCLLSFYILSKYLGCIFCGFAKFIIMFFLQQILVSILALLCRYVVSSQA